MNTLNTLKQTLKLSTMAAFLTACQLEVTSSAGGSISADSGEDCTEKCEYEIESTFTKTFYAIADEGYEFDSWAGQDNCETKPSCTVSVVVPAIPGIPLSFFDTEISLVAKFKLVEEEKEEECREEEDDDDEMEDDSDDDRDDDDCDEDTDEGGKEDGKEEEIIKAAYEWVSAHNGHVPMGSLKGGYEYGMTLYVCRASYHDSVHPGKLRSDFGGCLIPFGGHEILMTSYEMLVVNDMHVLDWASPRFEAVPKNAVVGGKESNSATLYVCRAFYNDGLHPGKIRAEFGGCNIGWGGDEITIRHYEVLIDRTIIITFGF